MLAYMSMRPKFTEMEGKMFVDPEDQVFELLCISKLEASVLYHLAPIFVLL
jgi:hypothetical protein